MNCKPNKQFGNMIANSAKIGVMAKLRDFLKDELDSTRCQNDSLEGVALYRNQGKSAFINELLELMDGDPEAAGELPVISPERIV